MRARPGKQVRLSAKASGAAPRNKPDHRWTQALRRAGRRASGVAEAALTVTGGAAAAAAAAADAPALARLGRPGSQAHITGATHRQCLSAGHWEQHRLAGQHAWEVSPSCIPIRAARTRFFSSRAPFSIALVRPPENPA